MIIPQFAQEILGYTATWSGLILSPGGVVVILLIPFIGRLMKFVQTRLVIATGFFVMGCALTILERAWRRTSTSGLWR